jgi:transcriptional regulator with XRE-family HTH domain
MKINVGARIKARRCELQMSQGELARLSGYGDRSVIAKFESGRSVPENKIDDIANALCTTRAYLEGSVLLNLEALGINVASTPEGILLSDAVSGNTVCYSKDKWDHIQAVEDFRTIFNDLNVQTEIETPAPGVKDERTPIQIIFDQLSADNQSKLLELAHLYLTGQHKTEET